MFLLILGLVLFLGIHSVRIVAPAWRDAQHARLGENGWKGLYSLISLAGFVLIVWGYARAWPVAPVLYEPPVWMKHLTLALMLPALISMMVFILPPGRLKPVLKHPMLLATKIWAFAHLLANGDLASVVLFGSFLVWAVLDRIAVKRLGDRIANPGPGKWDVAAVASGALVYVLFVWKLHEWLFGVSPL
ncbi:NnrU family protein [Mesorhizobium sp. ZC-5]|uniref:NnrU family protein n=1 Tax=Mesorhizobium sp. ZC-5 TaxID=2986066 RepID=UPI0021E8A010|nr:NnrU family protein [Mesorhizobium sp. ZC-5]MCV3242785.1 NnrU family protein [Mesorhizobium sp. ZC-5]